MHILVNILSHPSIEEFVDTKVGQQLMQSKVIITMTIPSSIMLNLMQYASFTYKTYRSNFQYITLWEISGQMIRIIHLIFNLDM